MKSRLWVMFVYFIHLLGYRYSLFSLSCLLSCISFLIVSEALLAVRVRRQSRSSGKC